LNRTYLKLTLDLDFILIAITAPLKDYVLCHKINTRLNTQFEKIEDHEIFFNIDEPAWCFSKYYFFCRAGRGRILPDQQPKQRWFSDSGDEQGRFLYHY